MSVSQGPIPNREVRDRAPDLGWKHVPLRDRSIRYVKGVGPRRMDQLAQLGIETIEDALYYPPRRYEDRTRMAEISQVKPGDIATIRARVLSKSMRRISRGQFLFEATVGDSSGVCQCLWFNQPYLAQQLNVEDEIILYGKFEPGGKAKMIYPEMEHVEQDGGDWLYLVRIVRIYPLMAGSGQRWLRQVVSSILKRRSAEIEEWLQESLRRSHSWP